MHFVKRFLFYESSLVKENVFNIDLLYKTNLVRGYFLVLFNFYSLIFKTIKNFFKTRSKLFYVK